MEYNEGKSIHAMPSSKVFLYGISNSIVPFNAIYWIDRQSPVLLETIERENFDGH